MARHLRAVPNPAAVPLNQRQKRARLPDVGEKEVRVLHDLVQDEGLAVVAGWIGVNQTVLLRVLAGLIHTCRTPQRNRVRAFFSEAQL